MAGRYVEGPNTYPELRSRVAAYVGEKMIQQSYAPMDIGEVEGGAIFLWAGYFVEGDMFVERGDNFCVKGRFFCRRGMFFEEDGFFVEEVFFSGGFFWWREIFLGEEGVGRDFCGEEGGFWGKGSIFFGRDFSGTESFFIFFYGRRTGKRDCLLDFLVGFFFLDFF